MPFLDVLHLFFDSSATIEERSSIFGKEWQAALQYVLHQPGLESLYTSRLSEKHELWAFLVWATEHNRSHFYHQSMGFGLLSDRMKKPPFVFFFGKDDYVRLGETKRWAVNALIAGSRGGRTQVRLSEQQENQFLESPGQYQFAARQERAEFEKLYQGNDFDYGLVGIINIGSGQSAPDLATGLRLETYEVELKRLQDVPYPTPSPSSINAPVSIADLTNKQPWEYGVLPHYNEGYKDTAYPMSLSFRPMSTMHMADAFLPAKSWPDSTVVEGRKKFTFCVVSIPIQQMPEGGIDQNTVEDLRRKLDLLDGQRGLREVKVLRAITPNLELDRICFVSAWSSPADLTRWWQATGSGACARIDYMWTCENIGWRELKWDTMPLTPDEQHWQEVDKILEVVDFKFEKDLADDEKTAFGEHVCTLVNKMSSCWSGDLDEDTVVRAEAPVWTTTGDAPSSCLLFLAWDGTEQRRAWLHNFMAEGFDWTGHIAHTLGAICSSIGSGAYKMDTLYTWQVTRDVRSPAYEEEEDDSDRDMGF